MLTGIRHLAERGFCINLLTGLFSFRAAVNQKFLEKKAAKQAIDCIDCCALARQIRVVCVVVVMLPVNYYQGTAFLMENPASCYSLGARGTLL